MAWSSTLTGYLLVMLAGLTGWSLALTPPAPFNLAALCVVVCGTAGYLLCCHTTEELRTAWRPIATVDPQAVRERLVQLARVARLDGGRGLERELGTLANQPLGVAGLRLVSSGGTPLELDQALRGLARQLETAARAPAEVWSSVARGALHGGALLSLVQLSWALCTMPPEAAYRAVAASLAGTMWGLLIAWLLAQPRMIRAKRAARAVIETNELWLTGWRAIAEGVHPLRLEDRLSAERAA